MKKITVIALVLVMVLSMAACGNKEKEETGMKSPMVEVESLEALSDKAEFAVVRPEGIELTDESYFIIEGEPEIAEYNFTVDGIECSLRFAKCGVETDICGVYGPNGTLYDGATAENFYIENDDLKIHRWLTVDGQYVLYAPDKGAMSWETFEGLYEQFFNVTPKTWNSSVPYADYQAIVGSYENAEETAVGAINIHFDHAGVYILIGQEDGSRNYYEFEAVLEDGKLVYDEETISNIAYDAEKGQTVTTPLENGGAGYITITEDGALDLSGAFSEELKGFVLDPRAE